MDISGFYNIFPRETFGTLIAIYFYLTGLSAGSFVLSTLAYVEKVMGKIVPALILLFPRLRNLTNVTISSGLVVGGIFFMRYVVVLGGEFLPLL